MDRVSVPVLDWIESLGHFTHPEDVWRKFIDFTKQYGFGHGLIYDRPKYKSIEYDNILSVSLPESWLERYITGKYISRDPIVRALDHTRGSFTWEESLRFGDYSRADQNIVFEARDHGLHGGFVVPIAGPRTRQAMVTIGGEGQALSRRDRTELHFAALYAHAHIRALCAHYYRGADLPELSSRERECLEWAAMGKSDWEIGEILAIASSTAGWHIERAKRKLGVSTRIQAVVIALQRGAISV